MGKKENWEIKIKMAQAKEKMASTLESDGKGLVGSRMYLIGALRIKRT